MSVIYAAALRTARMQAVRDAINLGSGPGKLEIGTSAMAATLVSVPLTDPVTVSGDVLTLRATAGTATATGTGTAAAARIRDSDNNDVVTGLTVGTSGTNIVLDSVSITSGQDVTISTATITHPST